MSFSEAPYGPSTSQISNIPDTMRALVLDGAGFERLRIAHVPTPRPGPRQMLARVTDSSNGGSVTESAICGMLHNLR